jgi:hypothetical protein
MMDTKEKKKRRGTPPPSTTIANIPNSEMILYIAIVMTFILALLEIVPVMIWLVNPKYSIGSTTLGNIYQSINASGMNHVGWLSYLIFFILLIYVAIAKIRPLTIQIIVVIVCIMFILLPGFPIITLLNLYLELKLKNPPFIYDYSIEFPQGRLLEKNYTHILGEYKNYESIHREDVACIKTNNPGFRIEKKLTTDNNCWRSIFLKKAGVIDQQLISYFPITLSLLQSDQIHNAFFSILDPHVDIPPHKGYFK